MRINLGSLGLAPDHPCYDANRAWYVPNFWIDSAECACLEADPNTPIGDKCASVSGVLQTMGGQVGSTVGSVATGVGEGVGTGISNAFNQSSMAGNIMLFGGLFALIMLLRNR